MDKSTVENQFIELLQSPLCKQVNTALLYSQLLHRDISAGKQDVLCWDKINQAVIDKWSKSGLKKIKTMAWQLIEGCHLRFEND